MRNHLMDSKVTIRFEKGYRPLSFQEALQDPSTLTAIIDAFLVIPADDETLSKIELYSAFQKSIQEPIKTLPYGLKATLEECQAETLDKNSLEWKFFKLGGTFALTAVARAYKYNKRIGTIISKLTDEQLGEFTRKIMAVKPASEFSYTVAKLENGDVRKRNLPAADRRILKFGKKRRHVRTKPQDKAWDESHFTDQKLLELAYGEQSEDTDSRREMNAVTLESNMDPFPELDPTYIACQVYPMPELYATAHVVTKVSELTMSLRFTPGKNPH
ncbi:uncharacterized protein F4822DRAFT_423523 [Hypoxylon trugodes]|uniref:uncharacterized protein n=1 Tax=Hypoxylon trugodes TaxID=326681 RepID=UPI0021946BF5|nr:uncharacterized protein F4822DRAFT_423523 [Hypoxylon trugodes]KAI1382531.1 hypothetical protein F4822DRAFT_423523 [Hypoxylon trugodes]